MNTTKRHIPIILLIVFLTLSAKGQDYVFPVVKGYGGVADLENAILPKEGGKIIIDLTSAEATKSGVSKSMDRIARLINLYGLAGIDQKELEIVVIIHGAATKAVLTDKAYEEKYDAKNPDLAVISALKDHGVKFMVCGQALVRRGFGVENLNPDIELALSAITTLVEFQQKGYAVLYY